jgi:hypothetical protein
VQPPSVGFAPTSTSTFEKRASIPSFRMIHRIKPLSNRAVVGHWICPQTLTRHAPASFRVTQLRSMVRASSSASQSSTTTIAPTFTNLVEMQQKYAHALLPRSPPLSHIRRSLPLTPSLLQCRPNPGPQGFPRIQAQRHQPLPMGNLQGIWGHGRQGQVPVAPGGHWTGG